LKKIWKEFEENLEKTKSRRKLTLQEILVLNKSLAESLNKIVEQNPVKPFNEKVTIQ